MTKKDLLKLQDHLKKYGTKVNTIIYGADISLYDPIRPVKGTLNRSFVVKNTFRPNWTFMRKLKWLLFSCSWEGPYILEKYSRKAEEANKLKTKKNDK